MRLIIMVSLSLTFAATSTLAGQIVLNDGTVVSDPSITSDPHATPARAASTGTATTGGVVSTAANQPVSAAGVCSGNRASTPNIAQMCAQYNLLTSQCATAVPYDKPKKCADAAAFSAGIMAQNAAEVAAIEKDRAEKKKAAAEKAKEQAQQPPQQQPQAQGEKGKGEGGSGDPAKDNGGAQAASGESPKDETPADGSAQGNCKKRFTDLITACDQFMEGSTSPNEIFKKIISGVSDKEIYKKGVKETCDSGKDEGLQAAQAGSLQSCAAMVGADPEKKKELLEKCQKGEVKAVQANKVAVDAGNSLDQTGKAQKDFGAKCKNVARFCQAACQKVIAENDSDCKTPADIKGAKAAKEKAQATKTTCDQKFGEGEQAVASGQSGVETGEATKKQATSTQGSGSGGGGGGDMSGIGQALAGAMQGAKQEEPAETVDAPTKAVEICSAQASIASTDFCAMQGLTDAQVKALKYTPPPMVIQAGVAGTQTSNAAAAQAGAAKSAAVKAGEMRATQAPADTKKYEYRRPASLLDP